MEGDGDKQIDANGLYKPVGCLGSFDLRHQFDRRLEDKADALVTDYIVTIR